MRKQKPLAFLYFCLTIILANVTVCCAQSIEQGSFDFCTSIKSWVLAHVDLLSWYTDTSFLLLDNAKFLPHLATLELSPECGELEKLTLLAYSSVISTSQFENSKLIRGRKGDG